MSLIGIDVRKLGDFGIGTYIRNLLAGLSELDQEHKYLLLRKAETDPTELPAGMESSVERSGLYSPTEPWRLGWSARRAGLDLLHCPHYVTPFLAGCPVAVTIHDLIHLLFPRYLPGRAARRYARFFLRQAARKAKVIFAVSNCTRDDILEHLPAREEQIIVTYEAVDPAMSREPRCAPVTLSTGPSSSTWVTSNLTRILARRSRPSRVFAIKPARNGSS